MGRNRDNRRRAVTESNNDDSDKPGAVSGEDIYEVDKIIGHVPKRATQHSEVKDYVIRWKGWDEDGDTVESAAKILRDCEDVVDTYWDALSTARSSIAPSVKRQRVSTPPRKERVITKQVVKMTDGESKEYLAGVFQDMKISFQDDIKSGFQEFTDSIKSVLAERDAKERQRSKADFELLYLRLQGENDTRMAGSLQTHMDNIQAYAMEFTQISQEANKVSTSKLNLTEAREILHNCKTIKAQLAVCTGKLNDLSTTITLRDTVLKQSLQRMADSWRESIDEFTKDFQMRLNDKPLPEMKKERT